MKQWMKWSLVGLVMLLVGRVQALVVNVDVEAETGNTYSGQGSYADPGNDFWNSSLEGMVDLTASDGLTATTIDVALSAGSRHAYSLSNDLMADYSYSRNTETSVDITGLEPNGTYLLYVYCQGDNASQNATVTFGSLSGTTSGDISGLLVEGGNYVVLLVSADGTGALSGTVAPNGSNYAAVNGLQIVELATDPTKYVVNVDLGGSSEGTVGDGDNRSATPYSGPGAYSDPGNEYWNTALTTENRTLTDVLASDGTNATPVDVAVSGGGGYEDVNKTNYLLSDYLYGGSTTLITDLNPSGNYTLFVYAAGDGSGQGSAITVGGVTKTTTNSGNPDAFSQGVNYVMFQTTADVLGRISIACAEKMNGFQLIEGEAAATGYEAEEAVYSGVTVLSDGNASGDAALENFDAVGDYIEYQSVEAGDTLEIRYSNGQTAATQCSVYVNGVDAATAVFSYTGSWTLFGTSTITVDIPDGAVVKLQIDADDFTSNNSGICSIQDKIDVENLHGVIVVDSFLELLAQLDKSNVQVKMTPGEYDLDSSDKESGLLPFPTFFQFNGDNCVYDFSGVTWNIDTEMYDDYSGTEIRILELNGDNNHLFGLTQKDLGDEPIGGGGVMNMTVAGDSNLFEEVSIYTRGSSPYGYGDLFGKGGGAELPLDKHAALLIEGIGCHILNCYIDHNAFGHGIFMQGAINTLVEGCYVKGHIRTTDQLLAEAGTGSQADGIDFGTTWGWKVPPGYAFSCQEDGIRAYNTGSNGRDTAYTTVKNCTVDGMRGGIPIGFSNNDNTIYGCTIIGAEGSFWPGNGNSVAHCQADAPYARLINNPYSSDNNQTYSLTVLHETEVYGNDQLIYLGGSRHDVTLLNSGIQPRPTAQTIQLGGVKTGLRAVDFDPARNGYSLSGATIVNWTDQPVVLETNSSSCSVTSYGDVTDRGTDNSVVSIRPVTITASAATADRYNTVDADDKTYWSAEGDGAWIQYDLGQTRNLYAVSIKWWNGASRSYSFDLQTSGNGSSWTTVYSGASAGLTDDWEEVCFPTQNARYIRLVGYGNSFDDAMQIVDVDVDLKDRFAMVKTKSDAGSSYIAQYTVDGDLNTRWAAQGDGQWIQYDFLKTKRLNAVGLAWYRGDSRSFSFDVLVSDHPMGPWQTVYSGDSSGSTADLETYPLTPVEARFVRIVGHGSTADDWNNLSEVFFDTDLVNQESGLVAHWDFEEGAGATVKDVSGNGFDGTFTGGSWTTGPDGGHALYFDGDDATVLLPARAFDSLSKQVTIAFWAYGGVSQPINSCVLRAEDASGHRMLNVHLPWSDGTVYWEAGNSNGYDQVAKAASGTQIAGAWNHWAFVKDGGAGTMDIYLNGALWVSANQSIRAVGPISQVAFGSGLGELSYEGLLDELKVYNTALKIPQIRRLYEQSSYYRAWTEAAGLTAAEAAWSENPDGDGLNNLAEYAFGGHPAESDATELMPNMVIPLEQNTLEYTFRRRVDAAERGLTYLVQVSDDLNDPDAWSTEAITQVLVEPLDAEFEQVVVNVGLSAQGFIRLQLRLEQ